MFFDHILNDAFDYLRRHLVQAAVDHLFELFANGYCAVAASNQRVDSLLDCLWRELTDKIVFHFGYERLPEPCQRIASA